VSCQSVGCSYPILLILDRLTISDIGDKDATICPDFF